MKNPKVSIILTSYNHERYIGKAIESVLNQTYKDFELIIADDCSRDKSWEIINSYVDPRIKRFKSDQNEKIIINKIFSMGFVKGSFVAIHHSDDLWEREKLEQQVEFLNENPEIGAVFTKVTVIDEIGNQVKNEKATRTHEYYNNVFDQENRSREEWLRRFFYEGNCLCHPSVLIRKECYDSVGYYNKCLRQLPDLDFWMRLCKKYKIYILPERLTKFRLHGNETNTSSATNENVFRSTCEYYIILNNYKSIKEPLFLLKMFPEMEKDLLLEKCIPEYCLAKAALTANHRAVIAFGMVLLGEIMMDEGSREKVKQIHNFSLDDYHAITGSIDLFNELNVFVLNKKLFDLAENSKLQIENIEKLTLEKSNVTKKLSEITTSNSWKMTAPLRAVEGKLRNILPLLHE